MWQLIINGPGYFDTTYDLPEGVTMLGRADENDIVLSGDLVSRRHARITARGDDLTIEDLGSRNGSRINGQTLTGTVDLKPGDTISVGENTLTIRQPSKVESAATEMISTSAGGVRRFGEGMDVGAAVVIARNVKDSLVLQALDNVAPFSNPFGQDSPAPVAERSKPAEGEPLGYESLLLLYKAAEALATAPSLQAFLDQTVDRVLHRVEATTAVVLLRHHSGTLIPAAVRHRGKLSEGEVPVSDAIVAEALGKGAAIAVNGVRDDVRFAGRESVLVYGVDQVLCIPLGAPGPDGAFAGVLYVNLNDADQARLAELLDLCTAVGHLIATGVARFRTEDRGKDEDRHRQLLERHHPPQIVERRLREIARDPAALTRIDARNVSVMAAELVGLGALAQRDAAALVDVLAQFARRTVGLVFSFDGTVERLTGDGIVALFGVPYSRGDDALRAVRAALALRADWTKAARRITAGKFDLKVSVHSGPVLCGLVGPPARLELATIGDTTLTAQLLCSSAEPGQVLISSRTLTGTGARFDVTPLGERPLRGGKDKLAVFEVLEEDVPVHTNPGFR